MYFLETKQNRASKVKKQTSSSSSSGSGCFLLGGRPLVLGAAGVSCSSASRTYGMGNLVMLILNMK